MNIIDFFEPWPTIGALLIVLCIITAIFSKQTSGTMEDKLRSARGFIGFVMLATLIGYSKYYLPEDHQLKNAPALLITFIYWILNSFFWQYIEDKVLKRQKSYEEK